MTSFLMSVIEALNQVDIISVIREADQTNDFTGNWISIVFKNEAETWDDEKWNDSSRAVDGWSPTKNGCSQLLFAKGDIEENIRAFMDMSRLYGWYS